MTILKPATSPAPALKPARLSDLIRDQPIDMQRHIHTAVIRAVGCGELRGLKLSEQFNLPHCKDSNRMLAKSDVAFLPADVPVVQKLIAEVVGKYSEKALSIGRNRLNYNEFLQLTPLQFELHLKAQLESDQQMRGYRR